MINNILWFFKIGWEEIKEDLVYFDDTTAVWRYTYKNRKTNEKRSFEYTYMSK